MSDMRVNQRCSLHLPSGVIARAERLAHLLDTGIATATRSDVLREAIRRGLDQMERNLREQQRPGAVEQ